MEMFELVRLPDLLLQHDADFVAAVCELEIPGATIQASPHDYHSRINLAMGE